MYLCFSSVFRPLTLIGFCWAHGIQSMSVEHEHVWRTRTCLSNTDMSLEREHAFRTRTCLSNTNMSLEHEHVSRTCLTDTTMSVEHEHVSDAVLKTVSASLSIHWDAASRRCFKAALTMVDADDDEERVMNADCWMTMIYIYIYTKNVYTIMNVWIYIHIYYNKIYVYNNRCSCCDDTNICIKHFILWVAVSRNRRLEAPISWHGVTVSRNRRLEAPISWQLGRCVQLVALRRRGAMLEEGDVEYEGQHPIATGWR